MSNKARCTRQSSFVTLVAGAVVSALVLVSHFGRAGGEPPLEANASQRSPEEARTRRLQQMRAAAARYSIFLGEDRARPLQLVTEPVLRFTNDVNPVKVAKDGSVFLWTDRGRPEAIVQFFTYDETHFNHEWQSLALSPLTAEWNGAPVWAPAEAGLKLRVLPEADAPAASATARLRQMKRLAERMSATFLPVVAGSDDKPAELRLLPQPLYRYESSQPDLLDGALFAFVLGTDPQALLVMEARRGSKESKFQWESGWARMASGALTARDRAARVWSVPNYDFKRDVKQTFLLLPQGPPGEASTGE